MQALSTNKQKLWASTITLVIILVAGSAALLPLEFQILLLGALVGGIVVVICIWQPQWLIYGLILFIPIEEFVEKWIPRGTFYEVTRFGGELLLFIILFFVLLEKARRGFRWNRTPLDLPFAIFLGVALISGVINSSSLVIGVLGIRPLIRYLMLYYVLTQMGVSREFYQNCLKLTFSIATVVIVIGLLQTLIGMPLTTLLIPEDVIVGNVLAREGLRHIVAPRTFIFSTMGRYDTLGVYTTLHILIAYGIYGFAPQLLKRKLRVFGVLAIAALILTYSRQSWVALALGIGLMTLLSRRREFLSLRVIYIFGALLIPILYLAVIPYAAYLGGAQGAEASVFERIIEPLSTRYLLISRFSFGRLFVILEVGPRILALAPIWGFGPGQFGSLVWRFFDLPFGELVGVPENAEHFINDVNWIIILGQMGLAGVFAYLWMYLRLGAAAFKRFYRWTHHLEKGVALGLVACVAIILLIGFLGPNFEVRQSSFYIWLWGGLLLGRRDKKESQPS